MQVDNARSVATTSDFKFSFHIISGIVVVGVVESVVEVDFFELSDFVESDFGAKIPTKVNPAIIRNQVRL